MKKNKEPKSGATDNQSPAAFVTALADDIDKGIDCKTVAIIMAAVSAACGVIQSNLKFTAIRRSNAYHSVWADRGTHAIINSRQSF